MLGAHEQGTLISELIAKLDPSAAPAWPKLSGTVDADSLVLGPVTLHNASATLNVDSTGVQIDDLAADLLGGSVHGSGTLVKGDQPTYTIEGKFQKLSPTAVGQLVGLRFSGGELAADGKVELTGFAGKDLKSSAKGTLHFEWRHGAVASASAGHCRRCNASRLAQDASAARRACSCRAGAIRSLDRRRRDRQGHDHHQAESSATRQPQARGRRRDHARRPRHHPLRRPERNSREKPLTAS